MQQVLPMLFYLCWPPPPAAGPDPPKQLDLTPPPPAAGPDPPRQLDLTPPAAGPDPPPGSWTWPPLAAGPDPPPAGPDPPPAAGPDPPRRLDLTPPRLDLTPPCGQTEGQTRVKTLPSPILRMRAVISAWLYSVRGQLCSWYCHEIATALPTQAQAYCNGYTDNIQVCARS